MKLITALVAGLVAAAFAAPAFAQEAPPTNPWPGKKTKIAFWVGTVTAGPGESIYGVNAASACVETNLFPRGEGVVFRMAAFNARTGEIIEADDVKYAYIKIPGQPNLALRYTPHGRVATAPWYWGKRWDIPLDYPLGVVNFEIVVKLKGKGNVIGIFKQAPLPPAQLTVVEKRLPL